MKRKVLPSLSDKNKKNNQQKTRPKSINNISIIDFFKKEQSTSHSKEATEDSMNSDLISNITQVSGNVINIKNKTFQEIKTEFFENLNEEIRIKKELALVNKSLHIEDNEVNNNKKYFQAKSNNREKFKQVIFPLVILSHLGLDKFKQEKSQTNLKEFISSKAKDNQNLIFIRSLEERDRNSCIEVTFESIYFGYIYFVIILNIYLN